MESIQDISTEINKLTSTLENKKEEKNKLVGAFEQGMANLESEYGFKTLEEAQTGYDEVQTALESTKSTIVTKFNEIKENFIW